MSSFSDKMAEMIRAKMTPEQQEESDARLIKVKTINTMINASFDKAMRNPLFAIATAATGKTSSDYAIQLLLMYLSEMSLEEVAEFIKKYEVF